MIIQFLCKETRFDAVVLFKRKFFPFAVLTTLSCLVEPEKLVHHILKDMHTTKKKKTRVILRMLPISGTCKAFVEDMKKYSETFFEPWFKAPNKGTFQIVYKARNNSHMSREEVIKELAGMYLSDIAGLYTSV